MSDIWRREWDYSLRSPLRGHRHLCSDAQNCYKILLNPGVLIPTDMEEKVGFEPTEPFGSTVFKTVAFNHSAISPQPVEALIIAGIDLKFNRSCRVFTLSPFYFRRKNKYVTYFIFIKIYKYLNLAKVLL